VPFTLVNTTAVAWPKSDYVLSYHWTLPDGSDRTNASNQLRTELPADLAPGASTGLDAHVKSPEPGLFGNARQAYVFEVGSVQPQDWQVPVADGECADAGPERRGGGPDVRPARLGELLPVRAARATGAASSAAVNARQRQLVFGYNALTNPVADWPASSG